MSDHEMICADANPALHHALTNQCESPIEQLFLKALMKVGLPSADVMEIADLSFPKDMWPMGDCVVVPQMRIGRYRLDFGILARYKGEIIKFAVECDGHDFHYRTKSQAQSDRKRDRYLTGCGFRVIRFTGSEIYADAEDCAAELHGIFCDVCMEIGNRQRRKNSHEH